MQTKDRLEAADVRQFKPRDFVVNTGAGERIPDQVQLLLDPLNGASLHAWNLARDKATKLHYHEYDEYWLWTKGRTMLTIRLPDGRSESLEIGPGWMVCCVRGIEHGHQPLEDWGCYECTSLLRPGVREYRHLHREL